MRSWRLTVRWIADGLENDDASMRRSVGMRPPPVWKASSQEMLRRDDKQIGRAHVRTPVTNAHLVCRLLLEKKKKSKKPQTAQHQPQYRRTTENKCINKTAPLSCKKPTT